MGVICTFKVTPARIPANRKSPELSSVKDPAGMVVEKVPTWSLTSSVRGLIPLLAVPRVKFPLMFNLSSFAADPRSSLAVGAKVAKGIVGAAGKNWRSPSEAGVENEPLGIALNNASKVNRETLGLKWFETNSSPHGLKSKPIGPLSPFPVI